MRVTPAMLQETVEYLRHEVDARAGDIDWCREHAYFVSLPEAEYLHQVACCALAVCEERLQQMKREEVS